jgi:hypothetical protein
MSIRDFPPATAVGHPQRKAEKRLSRSVKRVRTLPAIGSVSLGGSMERFGPIRLSLPATCHRRAAITIPVVHISVVLGRIRSVRRLSRRAASWTQPATAKMTNTAASRLSRFIDCNRLDQAGARIATKSWPMGKISNYSAETAASLAFPASALAKFSSSGSRGFRGSNL